MIGAISTSGMDYTNLAMINESNVFSLLNEFIGNVSFGDNLTVGNNIFYVDSKGGKVGIGTSSPSEKLTVGGNVNMTSNNITSVDCIEFKSGGKICDSP